MDGFVNTRHRFWRTTLTLGVSCLVTLGGMPALALAETAAEPVGVSQDAGAGVETDTTQVPEEQAAEQTPEEQAAEQTPEEQAAEQAPGEPAAEQVVEDEAASNEFNTQIVSVERVDPNEEVEDANGVSGDKDSQSTPSLSTQAVTQRVLSLNDRWTTFDMPGAGEKNGYIFTFTVNKPGLVNLAIQNWRNYTITWQLWDADMANRYWSESVSSRSPGSSSDRCYLRAGTYTLRVYPQGSSANDGGQVKLKGSTVASGYSVLNNSTFSTATPLRSGVTSKGLFTRDDNVAFYSFTVKSTQKLRFTCTEEDSKLDVVSQFYFYNSNGECMQRDWLERDVGNGVSVSQTVEHTFDPGTYYVKVTRGAKVGGPFTIRYSAAAATTTTPASQRTPHVSYRTHVQRIGWQGYVTDGAMSGTSGKSYRLEGINIKLSNLPVSGGIQYRTHVQKIGWQGWRKDGAMAGTSGKSYRLEAIEIKLTGELAKQYDVYYRVHCQRFGWMGWAKNGQRSGSAGYSRRLEGIQIVLVPKGKPAPGRTLKGITQRFSAPFKQKGKK